MVDDEKHCLDTLSRDLSRHCPQVEVLAQFCNPDHALSWLRQHQPDVVFLDVVMPQMTGFQMLEQLAPFPFQVIFTTAYSKYAVQALRMSAVDYLQKPIDSDELKDAVERVRQRGTAHFSMEQLEVLLQNLTQNNAVKRIGLPTNNGFDFIPTDEILYFKADGNYTYAHVEGKEKLFVTRSLKEMEKVLEGYTFCRIHHSYLINLDHLAHYIRGEGGKVEMSNGDTLPVSRNRKRPFLRRAGL